MHFDKFGHLHTFMIASSQSRYSTYISTSKNSPRFFFFFWFCFGFIFAFVIRTLRWDLSSIKNFWRKQLSWYRPALFNTPWNSLFSENCKMRWKARRFYKIKSKEQVIENIWLAGAAFVTLIGVKMPRVGLAFGIGWPDTLLFWSSKTFTRTQSYPRSGVLIWLHVGPRKLFQHL